MTIQVKSFIDGKYVDSTGSVEIFNPSTGEVLAISHDADPSIVDLAVTTATRVQKSWRNVAVHERAVDTLDGESKITW
jgi:acyl-CoA reductase-like NAD-dependent aldehyde dehydrogenase